MFTVGTSVTLLSNGWARHPKAELSAGPKIETSYSSSPVNWWDKMVVSPLDMQGALKVDKVQQLVDLHQLDGPLEVPYGGLQGMQGTLSINVVRSIQ